MSFLGGLVKGIGKVVSAPVRGIGHALKTSGIPIVSGIGGSAEKFGNAFAGKGGFLKNFLGGGIPLALDAVGGAGLAGALGGKGLGSLAGGIGKALTGPNMLGDAAGKLSLQKLIGAAGGISSIVRQNKQRKSAQNYLNSSTNQRNQLMSQILSPAGYGVPNVTPNLNQQSSATPGY
jgi:hypothetical protein